MNRETAIDLLNNLLERAKEISEKTFLTSREIVALEVILGSDGDTVDAITVKHEPRPVRAPLVSLQQVADADIEADMMLCIDFGTSLSKAFACIDTGDAIPDIVDLPIGAYGGSDNQLVTPSEMIIDGGFIYFGGHARKVFDDSEASPDRLIDSIKQYMTLGADVSNLSKIRVDPAKDPDQKFYQRDILLLYLAHLTRLTEKALTDKSHPINVRRRFAHPAWADANRQTNQDEMKIMMAEAIVLARSLSDRFLERLSVVDARAALDEVKNFRDALPFALIAEPVREATAAGAGALLNTPARQRQAYIIIDIGAGTTDVAGFYCVNNPAWDRPRVFEVISAADAIRSAGNVLDSALMKLLLSKSHLMAGSAEYHAASATLSRSKRTNKQRLFDAGSVTVELPTGDVVQVQLEEFLTYNPVMDFADKVRKLVIKTASAVAGDADRLVFVATGGGARLPILKTIAQEGFKLEGRQIDFIWRDPMPVGVAEVYPDLVDPYPQISVAVGGALPMLPDQRAGISEGIKAAPELVMAPMYKS